MTASPDKHWPPRLRHALRARLASLGAPLPSDLVIRHVTRATSDLTAQYSIEIRHSPGAGERMSVSDVHAPFRGEQDLEAVVQMGVRHAMAMNRRDARAQALASGGHDVHRPPIHMVEASPLVALAWALVESDRAGIDGQVHIVNGCMTLTRATITTPAGVIMIDGARTIRVQSAETWPDTVVLAMSGRKLSTVISLPACGRRDVDDAVSALVITAARNGESGFKLEVGSSPVLPLTTDDHGDDRTWLEMEPIPIC